MQNVDTTKYVIYADIGADGIVERPDVVGAIFGQTEGLLGSDLDLRDLQKTGRLGRIDVQITSSGGKSNGTISIPSSFDKVETAILAAALETIDRVGPCIARIGVKKIEDVRAAKRRYVIDRAKRILVEMFDENILETEEITEEIKQSVRVEEITHLGKDNLPAGPNVVDSDAILVVEADGALIVDLNDSPLCGEFNFLRRLIGSYPREKTYLLALCSVDADMFNFVDAAGATLVGPPEERKPGAIWTVARTAARLRRQAGMIMRRRQVRAFVRYSLVGAVATAAHYCLLAALVELARQPVVCEWGLACLLK